MTIKSGNHGLVISKTKGLICNQGGDDAEGIYFTDDALQDPYYFDDALTNRYDTSD